MSRKFNDNRMAKTPCPFCGYEFDANTCINNPEARPSPGDPTVCIGCGEIMVFDDDLRPRKATGAEMIDLQRDAVWPMIQRASLAVRDLRSENDSLAQARRPPSAGGKQ